MKRPTLDWKPRSWPAFLLAVRTRRVRLPSFDDMTTVPLAQLDEQHHDPDTKDALSSASSIDKKDDVSVHVSTSSSDLLPPLDEKPRFTDMLFRRRNTQPSDLDAIATRRSVYDDPILAKHYWPSEKYENLHRFDPDARWTFREERVCTRSVPGDVA